MTEDEMVRYHHQRLGHEFEQTPGDSGRQRNLMYCVHGVAKTQTRLSNWTTSSSKSFSIFLFVSKSLFQPRLYKKVR